MKGQASIIEQLARITPRTVFLLAFLACLAMELAALYFQFIVGLEPCPLCITQRMILIVAAVIFLAGVLHDPAGRTARTYAISGLLTTLLGMAVAIYHFTIQLLPHDELADCGPGASYILEHMALTDAIRAFLTGTGDCTEVVWSLFGLSMPFWVAIGFLALASLCVLQLTSSGMRARR